MGDRVEGLVHRAVNVDAGAHSDEVLQVDLSLGPEGRDVDLLENVSLGVECNDDIFGGVVAAVVPVAVVRHPGEDVQEEAAQRVELREVLADVGALASRQTGQSEALSGGMDVVVGLVDLFPLHVGQRFHSPALVLDLGAGVGPGRHMEVKCGVLRDVHVEVGLGEGRHVDLFDEVGDVGPSEGLGASDKKGSSKSSSHFLFRGFQG